MSNVRINAIPLVLREISISANTKRMIYCSIAGCTFFTTAELSSLDRIATLEKKLAYVIEIYLIPEVTTLRNEITLIKKPELHFVKAENSGHVRTSHRNDISASYHSDKVKQKERVGWIWLWICTEKIKITKEVKTGANTNPAVIKGVEKPRSVVICLLVDFLRT